MFDIRKYYEKENSKVKSAYENSIKEIKEICNQTKDSKDNYDIFFNYTGNFILKLIDLEKHIDDEYFNNKTFEELLKENNEFYAEFLPENYSKSYVNPTYCVEVFGDKFGQLMSCFYLNYRQYRIYVFKHKIFTIEEYNRLFIDVFNFIKNNKIEYDSLKEIITSINKKDLTEEIIRNRKERLDKNFKFYRDIAENSDLNDLRYLFKYPRYITENEIKTAKFFLNYNQEKIEKLARFVVEAYIRSFAITGKDISKKSIVRVLYTIGEEKIIRQIIKSLNNNSLDILINSVSSTQPNEQFPYDHRFDNALFFDEEFVNSRGKSIEIAFETCKEMMAELSGDIIIRSFGEKPFAPVNKKECLRLTPEQSKLLKIFQNNIGKLNLKYSIREETSFTIIAFPNPEIGDNFEKIFEDILEINMLENDKYELIQQKMIDTLDRADYVHIKGKGDNLTDIKVKMQELKNPLKETIFANCLADINIPLGEVYTSPQLKETNGTLHIEEIFLKGLKYINLKLVFEDGFVSEYSCNNFENEIENKKYIEENLFFPNKTLPIGEFAIGTNTLAYVIAKKHNIMDILPILIIEKMGPHFAIGDTCFSWSEDKKVYNLLNNKEMIAKDNEKSILRKTNIDEAYTNRHTDITLPYEIIEFIAAITKEDEKIDIIRDGRFVLAGTEELNKPFDNANC